MDSFYFINYTSWYVTAFNESQTTTIPGSVLGPAFEINFLSEEYTVSWRKLTDMVYLNHTLPPNYALANDSAGFAMRPVNLSADKDYLKNIYYTFLAPRRCSTDDECLYSAQGATCVLDTTFYIPWRNGDVPVAGYTGDEGLLGKKYIV